MVGRKNKDDNRNHKYPKTVGCGIMATNPSTIVMEKVIMIVQSVLFNCFLSTIARVKNISSGPQANHSPHSAAGVATLIMLSFLFRERKVI